MSFGGSDPEVILEGGGIYEPAEPYIKDIMAEAAKLYASGVGSSYYPGSTVVPFAPETTAALDMAKGLGTEMAGPSSLYNMAGNTLGGFASGSMPSAYSQLTPQADYLSDVRSSIGSDVMGNISTQFGGMGRTGTSPGAQQAAARGFANAYAPIAQSAAEAERARELQSRETALSRQFQAAGALPGLQDTMDARRLAGISGISGVGSAFEDLAARELQDRINRFEFEQKSPYDRLTRFSQFPFAAAGFGMPTTQYAPSANPLTSAFGLGQAGFNLGSQFGYGGLGAILGGLGGLLG
tara:strand:- start:4790 stop:5677 length:888 start_codon:yes stop_codon:yes gene_type:complete